MTTNDPPTTPAMTGKVAPGETERILRTLAYGDMELYGLIPWSSNYTFLAKLTADDGEVTAIYKPSRGTQQLWDFDSHTLCHREMAAYRLSAFLGWPDIPPVVLRSGLYGMGSAQLFIEHDPDACYFTLREYPQHIPVFQRVALFDYLVNNADRKGGHLLRGTDGTIWAIDHGLTFHPDYKLRTVIWEHAGQAIPANWLGNLQTLRDALEQPNSPLVTSLTGLLAQSEVEATLRRTHELLSSREFPRPQTSWRNVPYPLI